VPLTPISRVADDGVASAWNTGSRLVEHVQDALSNPATNRRLVLGPVDEAQRMQLKAVGGQDLANHWFVIDGSNIRHVVKSHGDPIAEALRGQSAVDSDVWTSLPSVLQHPDHVEYLGMQNGAPQYGFWKKINGHAFTVLVERSGKQVLQVQSVRVHKNPLY